MGLGDEHGKDGGTYMLSKMRKRMRGREGKSGRKKPRKKDLDYSVIPAPDAATPQWRKKLSTLIHSTPVKHAPEMDGIMNISAISDDGVVEDIIEPKTEETTIIDEFQDISTQNPSQYSHKKNVISYPWEAPELDFLARGGPREALCECLENGCFLVDEVIERAIKCIVSDSQNTQRSIRKVMFCESFIYTCSRKNTTTQIASFLCNNDALNNDLFLMLVNTPSHWLLVLVDIQIKSISIINSMLEIVGRNVALSVFTNIFRVVRASFSIANIAFDPKQWKFYNCMDVPQQKNGFDCEVHVVLNTYCIVNELPLVTTIQSSQSREWIRRLVNGEQPEEATVKERSKIHEAKALVQKSWNDVLSVSGFEDTSYATICGYFDQTSKWDTCAIAQCKGDKAGEEQVFCVSCRRWYHRTCLPGILDFDASYFCCTIPHLSE
uniref:uncharacterized protein LOC120342723 n=1 Tax=Styela clava TaxID=7725 RepID=UPI00193998C8|nr:uncharacterized protein LOC120342723 [Styela clava]